MNSNKFYDIVVAKNFEIRQNGQLESRKVWNKVGRAWCTRTPGTFSFELYLIPGQHYYIDTREDQMEKPQNEEAPF